MFSDKWNISPMLNVIIKIDDFNNKISLFKQIQDQVDLFRNLYFTIKFKFPYFIIHASN